LRMRASMHMLMFDLQKHGSGRVRTILIYELDAPEIFVLHSPVIFSVAVRKNHFTVYQNSSLASAGMVSDTFLKEKRKRKKKVVSKARRGSDEMVSHSRRASPLTKA